MHEAEKILLFAQNHDQLVGKIARQGRDFIWNYLTMENVELYWKELLLEYHQLFAHQRKIIREIRSHSSPSTTETIMMILVRYALLCLSNGQIFVNLLRAMITCYEKCFSFYSLFFFLIKEKQHYQLNKLIETL